MQHCGDYMCQTAAVALMTFICTTSTITWRPVSFLHAKGDGQLLW
jgi:hypothetical protein